MELEKSAFRNHHTKDQIKQKLATILYLGGSFDKEQDSCVILNCLSTESLLVMRN